MKSLER